MSPSTDVVIEVPLVRRTVIPRRDSWIALWVTALARGVLVCLLSLVVWTLVPAVAGWHPTVVSSASMAPRLHIGDVVVSRPTPATLLSVGQIVLVSDPDHAGELRLHRYVRTLADGRLILRGDANRRDDSTPVASAALRGVAVLRVPALGRPMLWVKQHDVGATLLFLLAIGSIGILACWFRPAVAGEPQR